MILNVKTQQHVDLFGSGELMGQIEEFFNKKNGLGWEPKHSDIVT